jgi:diguanylate cyclase (GGDEF)-like protein
LLPESLLLTDEEDMTARRLRVLLAEVGPGEIATALRAVYPEPDASLELTSVSSVATLLPTIKVVDPEVILLDLSLNSREPQNAVYLVHRAAPGVPLIVVSDVAHKSEAAITLTQGAMDYVLKEYLDTRTLDRVLRAALERNTVKGLADLLRDPVTNLYTREGFITVGTRRFEETQRNSGSMVLICAVVGNLRSLRDRFGPAAVDRAVCDIAEVLKSSCRRSDIVARLGEAEFVILGVDAAAPSAEVMRKRLQQHVDVYNHTRSPWGPIELRTGAGSWSGRDARSFTEFLSAVEATSHLHTSTEQEADQPLNHAPHR